MILEELMGEYKSGLLHDLWLCLFRFTLTPHSWFGYIFTWILYLGNPLQSKVMR